MESKTCAAHYGNVPVLAGTQDCESSNSLGFRRKAYRYLFQGLASTPTFSPFSSLTNRGNIGLPKPLAFLAFLLLDGFHYLIRVYIRNVYLYSLLPNQVRILAYVSTGSEITLNPWSTFAIADSHSPPQGYPALRLLSQAPEKYSCQHLCCRRPF